MKKTVRLMALLLAVAVFSVILLSSAFIVLRSGHECPGEGCRLCCQLVASENNLKTLSWTAAAVLLALTAVYAAAVYLPVLLRNRPVTTLITLKIKLSN